MTPPRSILVGFSFIYLFFYLWLPLVTFSSCFPAPVSFTVKFSTDTISDHVVLNPPFIEFPQYF